MALSLYMDHHVPRPITNGLRLRGVDVLTAAEDGVAELELEDPDLLDDLELIATAVDPAELRNQVIFLPL